MLLATKSKYKVIIPRFVTTYNIKSFSTTKMTPIEFITKLDEKLEHVPLIDLLDYLRYTIKITEYLKEKVKSLQNNEKDKLVILEKEIALAIKNREDISYIRLFNTIPDDVLLNLLHHRVKNPITYICTGKEESILAKLT